jgi:hypothetical protein
MMLARFLHTITKGLLVGAGRAREWVTQLAKSRLTVPAQTVDATLAWSLSAGVWNPKVFLGR